MITQKLLTLALIGTEWIIEVLLLLSVVSIAVMLERGILLFKRKGNFRLLQVKLIPMFQEDDVQKVTQALKKDPSSAAHVAASVLNNVQDKSLTFEECVSIAISNEKLFLEKRIAFLGTVASIAPFIGLFGTVLGIIKAFHGLSTTKQGGPVVMAGISEALVATALGLLVAIPAVSAYNFFMRSIKTILIDSENFSCAHVLSYIRRKKIGFKG